jgi:hypothetical protein
MSHSVRIERVGLRRLALICGACCMMIVAREQGGALMVFLRPARGCEPTKTIEHFGHLVTLVTETERAFLATFADSTDNDGVAAWLMGLRERDDRRFRIVYQHVSYIDTDCDGETTELPDSERNGIIRIGMDGDEDDSGHSLFSVARTNTRSDADPGVLIIAVIEETQGKNHSVSANLHLARKRFRYRDARWVQDSSDVTLVQ